MAGKNLSNMTQLTRVKAASASAGAMVNSDSVDMLGWYGVLFFGSVATANANNFAHAAQSDDNAAFNDLAGTKVVPATAGDSFLLDIYRPTGRYVRCSFDRTAANTAVGEIYALQYGSPRIRPGTHGSTILTLLSVSPDEGAP